LGAKKWAPNTIPDAPADQSGDRIRLSIWIGQGSRETQLRMLDCPDNDAVVCCGDGLVRGVRHDLRMGQQNRLRRASKSKARKKAADERPFADTMPPGRPVALELIMAELVAVVGRRALGVDPAVCVAPFISGRYAADIRELDIAFAQLLRDDLVRLFAHGWTPVDLHQVTRRRFGARHCDYLGDLIATTVLSYAQPLLHQRFRSQLDDIEAGVWWSGGAPHLSQWLAARDLTREDGIAVALDLLVLFDGLPSIQETIPAPGSPAAAASEAAPPGSLERKMLAKVRALLAKAEATEFTEEADALSAKAQDLMARYALSRALLEHETGVRQCAIVRRLWLENPYINGKAMLVSAVADANRCRAVLSAEWGYLSLVGDSADLDAVELLSTSLLVQASRAMLSSAPQATRSGTSRTRSYRQSFWIAYATRIGERLREASEGAAAAVDKSRLLPALAARTQVVEEQFNLMFPMLVQKSVSISNSAGWGAGRAAADRAHLDVRSGLLPVGQRAG
jgi:hypothetical protein